MTYPTSSYIPVGSALVAVCANQKEKPAVMPCLLDRPITWLGELNVEIQITDAYLAC